MVMFGILAASVASQWLELLHQDIKGRLSGIALFFKLLLDVFDRSVCSNIDVLLCTCSIASQQEESPGCD